MKLSIVTINLNNKEGLERTLQSVSDQTFPEFEYLVIDGDSADGSKEIILQYKETIDYWVSERDSGVYEAMNKGIRKASGEYVLFLNSGDSLATPKVLESVIDLLGTHDLHYGNLIWLGAKGEKLDRYPKQLSLPFLYQRSLPHPATFIRRDLFETHFYYNENYKIVSDWEFFMVVLLKGSASYQHLGITISKFDADGLSNSVEHRELKQKERRQVMEARFPILYPTMKEYLLQNRLLKGNRFRMLRALEKSKFARKLNSLWLRVWLFLLQGKQLKDL